MKFGIFYEMQLPKPWGPNSERDIYQQSLDQVELADELGEIEERLLNPARWDESAPQLREPGPA